MKKIFYVFLFVLLNTTMFAQAPGGVAGSVLWLKANAGVTASGGVVDTWNDNSPQANHFTQSTAANKPALTPNVYNFYSALDFDGANSFMVQPTPTGFPAGNADRTIFVVATAGVSAGYRWIFAYGSPFTGTDVTCQTGNFDGALTNAFFGSTADMKSSDDVLNPYWASYWDNVKNSNGALASYTLNGTNETQYHAGLPINTKTVSATLTATSVNGIIGALTPTPIETWWGSIGEILMFNTALTDPERNQVESYLALKYGFTLGSATTPINYVASDGITTYWTGTAAYQHDIFGIGNDIGTALAQTTSNSINTGSGDGTGQNGMGNLILSAASLSDKQFLMIGSDSADIATEQTIGAGEAPAGTVGSKRVARNWRVQNTGGVGAVDLSFDMTGLIYTGGATASNYRLMVDQDGDGNYNTGTLSYLTPAAVTGNLLQFTNITLPDEAVFTVLTQVSATLPAVWEGFNVSLQKNKATLTWKTSSEINVDRYVAEYSQNGVTYLTAGTVTAKNSAGLNVYTLVQENLPAGIRYYRIKRIDKDGQFQLSEVKSVRAGGLSTVVLKANPVVKGRLDMIIDVPQNQTAVIRVVSTTGKMIVQQNTGLSTGSNNISTDISRAAAGTYILQVQLANEVINKKFVRL